MAGPKNWLKELGSIRADSCLRSAFAMPAVGEFSFFEWLQPNPGKSK
jgi:hypothetical protein